MLLRISVVTAVIAAAMFVIAQGTLMQRAGLVGGCQAVAGPWGQGGTVQACRKGKLEGRPDLRRESCRSLGFGKGLEYWRCPAPVAAGRRTSG